MSNANIRKSTRAICEAAISVAIALVLSLLEFKIWAQGGSVDFVMVPLLIFALRWGPGWGIGAGAVFGLLKSILLEGIGYSWASIFLDYILAYGCVGLAGIFKGKNWGVVYGTVLASAARFVFHLVSGVVLYASYMPDVYFGMDMSNVWFYSTIYNGTYMLPNMVLSIIILILLKKPMKKFITAEDIATSA